MQIAILTFDGFNELDSFVAAAILNRLRPHGWAAHISSPTEQVTSMNRDRAIIKPPFVAQRRADKYQRQKIGRRGHEAFDRGGNRRVQCILQKKIVDRVARQGQLRENGERGRLRMDLRQQSENRLHIGVRIGQTACRRAGCDACKTLTIDRAEIHRYHSSRARPAQRGRLGNR